MSRRVLPALCGLLLAALAPSTAFAAPPRDYVGANVQPLVKLKVVAPERWDAYAERMAADGLRIARLDTAWAWVEPDPPVDGVHRYLWDRPGHSLDNIVALFARHRIRVSAALTIAPAWAGREGTEMAREDYDDYAAFAGAVAERYGSRGTFWREHPELPHMPLHDYGVWNEPNSTHFWTGVPDAREYVDVLRRVVAAIRPRDPAAVVMPNIGWPDFEGYVDALYVAGVRGLIDGMGFHPYGPTGPTIVDMVRRIRVVMERHGDGALPLYVTEAGQAASFGTGASRSTRGRVSDRARAATHAFAADALARSDCDVRNYLMYALVGSETFTEPLLEGFMGLYRVSEPRPNATGRALADVAARWREAPSNGLRVCGGGTPETELLRLDALINRDGPGCVKATIRYRGYPLEGTKLRLALQRVVAEVESDAYGQARTCVPAALRDRRFTAYVAVDNVARSATFDSADPCARLLELTVATPAQSATRVSVRLRCNVVRARRLGVYLQRRGDATRRHVRDIAVRYGRTLRFAVPARLRRGDRLLLRRAPNSATSWPSLSAAATVR